MMKNLTRLLLAFGIVLIALNSAACRGSRRAPRNREIVIIASDKKVVALPANWESLCGVAVDSSVGPQNRPGWIAESLGAKQEDLESIARITAELENCKEGRR